MNAYHCDLRECSYKDKKKENLIRHWVSQHSGEEVATAGIQILSRIHGRKKRDFRKEYKKGLKRVKNVYPLY